MKKANEPEGDVEHRAHDDLAGRVDAKAGARAYRTPRLTYVGTVRELTMGPGGSGTEGGFPKGTG